MLLHVLSVSTLIASVLLIAKALLVSTVSVIPTVTIRIISNINTNNMLIAVFQSPSSWSWSSVRMRMMFGRMLRRSLWRRGFRRWPEGKWAWPSVTEMNRKRRSRPAMAFDPWPPQKVNQSAASPVESQLLENKQRNGQQVQLRWESNLWAHSRGLNLFRLSDSSAWLPVRKVSDRTNVAVI